MNNLFLFSFLSNLEFLKICPKWTKMSKQKRPKCDKEEKSMKIKMPRDEMIYDLAEFFKVFADSTRMKIIFALMDNELCVCDIANIVKTTQSAISHQLRLLKQSKLVKFRKEGKVVYYSLDDEHISQIVKKGREHIEEL